MSARCLTLRTQPPPASCLEAGDGVVTQAATDPCGLLSKLMTRVTFARLTPCHLARAAQPGRAPTASSARQTRARRARAVRSGREPDGGGDNVGDQFSNQEHRLPPQSDPRGLADQGRQDAPPWLRPPPDPCRDLGPTTAHLVPITDSCGDPSVAVQEPPLRGPVNRRRPPSPIGTAHQDSINSRSRTRSFFFAAAHGMCRR